MFPLNLLNNFSRDDLAGDGKNARPSSRPEPIVVKLGALATPDGPRKLQYTGSTATMVAEAKGLAGEPRLVLKTHPAKRNAIGK